MNKEKSLKAFTDGTLLLQKQESNLYSWVWGFLHWSHDANALWYEGQLAMVLLLWVGNNPGPPPGRTVDDSQQEVGSVNAGQKVSCILGDYTLNLCLAQSQELNTNSEGGISISRTEDASVRLLQGLGSWSLFLNFHPTLPTPGRAEKLKKTLTTCPIR